jgi:hypothetical protein
MASDLPTVSGPDVPPAPPANAVRLAARCLAVGRGLGGDGGRDVSPIARGGIVAGTAASCRRRAAASSATWFPATASVLRNPVDLMAASSACRAGSWTLPHSPAVPLPDSMISMGPPRDILEEYEDHRRRPVAPDGHGHRGHGRGGPGQWLLRRHREDDVRSGDAARPTGSSPALQLEAGRLPAGGATVTLVRASGAPERGPVVTASGALRTGPTPAARTARASRIWVEGRHDAELLEHVWGDELREMGIVVEPLHGADDLSAAISEFRPGPAAAARGPARPPRAWIEGVAPGCRGRPGARARDRAPLRRRVGRHPARGDRPVRVARRAARRAVESGAVSGARYQYLDGFWPRLRNRVRTYADLRPELVGAVERLIDFVGDPGP